MHYKIVVIGEDVEKLLAPFSKHLKVEEYEEGSEKYHRNPNGKWDWYEIGGRWTTNLKAIPGAESGTVGPRLPHSHPSGFIGAAPLSRKPGWYDSLLKKEIDFAGMDLEIRHENEMFWHDCQLMTDEVKKTLYCDEEYKPLQGESFEVYHNRVHRPWRALCFLQGEGWIEKETWDGKIFVKDPNWIQNFWSALNDVGPDERVTIVDIHN